MVTPFESGLASNLTSWALWPEASAVTSTCLPEAGEASTSPLMVLTVTVWSALNWPFQWKFLVSSARAKDESARRELNAREEQRMRMGAFMREASPYSQGYTPTIRQSERDLLQGTAGKTYHGGTEAAENLTADPRHAGTGER